ncbi:MAG: hypothetical protein WC466_03855 [Candidatus Izemoplasmatales bacterium]
MYNQKTSKKEIRNKIRKIINEFVSPPGTTFGPYEDKVEISKKKMKPQYFSIALSRAGKFCSDSEITDSGFNCNIEYEITKTPHSVERQYRHSEITIEDEDIQSLIDKSIDKVTKFLLTNILKNGDYIHVKDKFSNLNAIFSVEIIKSNGDIRYKFPLITVINKEKFIPYTGTKTIEV